DVRLTFRFLTRKPLPAAAVAMLALAIGINTAVFPVLDAARPSTLHISGFRPAGSGLAAGREGLLAFRSLTR
ncbi:MAG: hypothetical protein ACRD9L_09920, partial [Bryobacteraceae bacterium]